MRNGKELILLDIRFRLNQIVRTSDNSYEIAYLKVGDNGNHTIICSGGHCFSGPLESKEEAMYCLIKMCEEKYVSDVGFEKIKKEIKKSKLPERIIRDGRK